MQNSSIFFNDLTVIDFSVINADGQIVGGSATLNLEVSGPVDNHEGVVIDFSAGKKQIKALIDGVGGFDHKCWINVEDPNIIITTDAMTGISVVRHAKSGLVISGEEDAFTWLSGTKPEDDIRDFLNSRLAPYTVSNVFLNTSIIPVPLCNTSSHVFRYVHGLKYSSSHGCKNIAHGHKSYIAAVLHDGYSQETADKVLASIAMTLDGTIFAHDEDVKSAGTEYEVEYSTPERGPMYMKFIQKFIVLETQTTVEHLVEYIRARFFDQLKAVGVKELYVSEGLCKGARASI